MDCVIYMVVFFFIGFCQEIYKAGLEEGSRIAISQYESTLILKLKEISEKLNGPSKAIIDALRTTLEENIK